MSNVSLLPASSRAWPGVAFAVFLAATSGLAQTTWLAEPTDNLWNTSANWSTGAIPSSSEGAVFGYSTITGINIPSRLSGASFTFTSSATTAYVFNITFSSSTHVISTGIFNDSPWAPTFNFIEGADLRLTAGASLDDAQLVFSSGSAFMFIGQGGTATIQMNGGTLSYDRLADGENARLILGGGTLLAANAADVITFRFGSIEGSGRIELAPNCSLVVGSNDRDATYSGSIVSESTTSRSITKTGSGTWTLDGTNTSNADFTINGGALAIDRDDRLGLGGSLTLDGGRLRATGAITGLRALIVGAAGGTLDTQGHDVVQTGGLAGTGLFTKLGSGLLELAAAGTLTGDVRLAEGTLALGDDAALGTGRLLLDGGAMRATAAGPRTVANAVTLRGDATLSGSQDLTFTGDWTLARNRELTVTNSALTTISGRIGESGGSRTFAKYGAGTLILTGANTYTGGTLLAEGVTRINNLTGSAFGTGAVTLADGATLTGAGSFSGAFQNNGTYAPGNSPALITFSAFSQGSTGILEMELGGLVRGADYDALNITGSAVFDGTLSISLINGFDPVAGSSFDLFDWSSVSGTFAALYLPTLAEGLFWDTSALYTDGVLSVAAIPEPAAFTTLAALGCLALAACKRRRRTA